MIRATAILYRDCARDAARSLARSPLALAVFVVVPPVLGLIAGQVARSAPGIGGFIVGFLQAGAAGWYLALVEIAVNGQRPVRISDLGDQLGTYLWQVMSVMFLFFIAQLLLIGAPWVFIALMPVATVAFNPAPEMIYQDRTQSVELLGGALKFMQENWPEWLVPQVFAIAIVGGIGAILSHGAYSLFEGVGLMAMFGPSFGFASPGAFAIPLANGDVVSLALGLFMLVFAHGFMLFRGHLYRRLRGSSRRGRDWATRGARR